MPLNKSKGNMFTWVTHTWNPIAGECKHLCQYCSTNKLKNRYEVIDKKYSGPMRLVEKELNTNLGSGNTIFVASQNDLFANEVSNEDILSVLNYCYLFNNKYLFQTKNPLRLQEFIWHDIFNKSILATTIESDIYYKDFMGKTLKPSYRASIMRKIYEYTKGSIPMYLTIEPIMDFTEDFIPMINSVPWKQINIGADSSNNNLPEPNKEKINNLIKELEKVTKVKIKDNLKRLL